MALTLTTPNTLLGTLNTRTGMAKAGWTLATILAGTAILAASARFNIPMLPVPVTFQTLAVAVLAAAFGWRVAVATVAAYIAEGLAGIPVFSSGGGIGYLFQPSFGFIVGFLPMAYVIGRAADAGVSRRPLLLLAAILAGDAVCLVFGYAWLVAMSGHASWIDQSNVLGSAFSVAVAPFLVWDILKMVFATATVTGAWALLGIKR